MVVPFFYEELERLECGCYKMKKEGLYGLIDANNNILVAPSYEQIIPCDGPLIQLINENDMAWYDPFTEKYIWSSKAIRQ
jgi:hypothetical protein